jgi:hypothetical protein
VELVGPERDRQIDRAFWLALGRGASPEETAQARELFANAAPADALARLGLVLFNLSEFIYLE